MIGTLVTKTLLIAGEGGCRHDAVGPARRDAARLRQGDGQGSRRRVHAGAAERIADDLHADGKQYIVVAISGGNYSGELLAFRVPWVKSRRRGRGVAEHTKT